MIDRPLDRLRLSWIGFLELTLVGALVLSSTPARAESPAVPVFENGQAQIVEAFEDPNYWIREDLWVETEFDSDGDDKLDRMHVGVTRPRQTETEGLKLPVVYVSSPYFAGTGDSTDQHFWNPRHELGETPPPRKAFPPVERTGMRPIISMAINRLWRTGAPARLA